MLQFPRSLRRSSIDKNPFHIKFLGGWRSTLTLCLVAMLLLLPLSFNVAAQQPPDGSKPSPAADGDYYIIYRGAGDDTVCRLATAAERDELRRINPAGRGLRPINHLERELNSSTSTAPQGDDVVAANLTIVLRATSQLDNFPEAKAAFIRAAATWEGLVKSPVTLYMDVDYGPTFFGQPWESGVLGATSSPSIGSTYPSVRNNLIVSASTAAETALYNSLPSSTLPTDLGSAGTLTVSSSIARAIGLLPATAQPTDTAARIAFNSSFQFDFDPSNGITAGQTDFEAVATHEIGHALGFTSRAGVTTLQAPAIWDLFRFRTGTTLNTFSTAQRIMSASGLQYFFSGGGELNLSTGGPNGDATGGDGNQSSHWKQSNQNGGVYIGIMDPRIPSGTRRVVTANDTFALNYFGFNLDNNNPPPQPPPPPVPPVYDIFANALTLTACTGKWTGSNVSTTKEAGEPSHAANNGGGKSLWFRWQAPGNGLVTVTTAGSDFDTMLAVYTGSTVGGLTKLVDNDDEAFPNIITSRVQFTAVAGTTYRIAVDGYDGDSGAVTLNWSLAGCATGNPIDGAQYFVDRQYQDFLGRAADLSGLQYWTEQVAGNASNAPPPCPPGDRICENIRHINVSAAFFVENEFQRTGGFVVRFYKASFGTNPTFAQFNADRALVPENAQLEASKQAFAAAWVQRPDFTAKYPTSQSGPAFVDAMLLNVLQNSGVDLSAQRASLINDFNAGGRAQVVRNIADNAAFAAAEYNRAFVLMQYFGYLQRDPDTSGYQFWLDILNNQVPNNFRAMVCAFLTSTEYQQRFGSTITRNNQDCANVGP